MKKVACKDCKIHEENAAANRHNEMYLENLRLAKEVEYLKKIAENLSLALRGRS